MPRWMTAKEAMEYLRVSKATFFRLVKAGKIPAYALSGTDERRYREEDLDALLTPLSQEHAEEPDA